MRCPNCRNTLGQFVDGEIVSLMRVATGRGGVERRKTYSRRVECEKYGCGGYVDLREQQPPMSDRQSRR